MKSKRKIAERFRQRKFRALKKIITSSYNQTPHNCKHNMTLDLNDVVGECIYLCGVQPATLCDPKVNECIENASSCEYFAPLNTKEELREAFDKVINNDPDEVLLEEFPEIATLKWVLEGTEDSEEILEEETPLNLDGEEISVVTKEENLDLNSELPEPSVEIDLLEEEEDQPHNEAPKLESIEESAVVSNNYWKDLKVWYGNNNHIANACIFGFMAFLSALLFILQLIGFFSTE